MKIERTVLVKSRDLQRFVESIDKNHEKRQKIDKPCILNRKFEHEWIYLF
jgi:hypothetical protein